MYNKAIEIAEIAKALSHPVRVYIVMKLSSLQSCCYSGDLFNELDIARSTLSQHLKELKYFGLIKGEVEGPYIKYCINKEKWEQVKVLLNNFINQ
jgi:DNA-binding transcriptional ArsR family regulator